MATRLAQAEKSAMATQGVAARQLRAQRLRPQNLVAYIILFALSALFTPRSSG
jgi:hypothetical protein